MAKDRVKFSTKRHKKRKGFCGRKVVESENRLINVNTSVNSDSSIVNSESLNVNNESTNLSNESTASEKKIQNIAVTSTPDNKERITGYRLVDMEILSFVFSALGCPECCKCELNLGETFLKKKGLASCLLLTCKNCGYSKDFYTSVSNDNSFDINIRTVYSMRACGQGYAGLEKLTALMNLPQPMTANNYDKIVNRLNIVVKEVANETMRDASEDLLSKIKDPNEDAVIDTAVSCDGSWQKRGY